MTRSDMVELFLIQIRGELAKSFIHSNISPMEYYWPVLKGEQELTLREIGEIGHLTGCEVALSVSPRAPIVTEDKDDE